MYGNEVIVYIEAEAFERAHRYLAQDPEMQKWDARSFSMMEVSPTYGKEGVPLLPKIFDFENGDPGRLNLWALFQVAPKCYIF